MSKPHDSSTKQSEKKESIELENQAHLMLSLMSLENNMRKDLSFGDSLLPASRQSGDPWAR
jgi:hypothetical protein